MLERQLVRGRLELPDGTPLPGGQVLVQVWADPQALLDRPDRPDGHGAALATGQNAQFQLLLGRGTVARIRPFVRHASGQVVELRVPQEGAVQDIRVIAVPTTNDSGVELQVRGDVPVTQVTCRVKDTEGRDLFFKEAGADRMRVPLAPGRYSLKLSSRNTRSLQGQEHRWGRYLAESVDVVVPKEGFVSVVHQFELKAFVAVMPEVVGLGQGDALPQGREHLRFWARLRPPGADKDLVGWDYSWWLPGRSVGGAKHVPPGTYDLVVGGPDVETVTLSLVVEAGEFLRPHVRLELRSR